ncbi:nucleotide-diphospho-sugar transferase [Chryseolinea lacunae]|uniref:Nucleotide-diphospho-sugar transferase n=1 Tax=Chryseolinea lacunae TaxID=2801331 RepID=A0ABS1KRX4_9BACT|nr:nucleotide-diphospho-sugar transferase [Chryseolinea lacunae]MBL0742214.1 nucleotide-diphospho-sugar transferase [Chryseolinea lacunae]
MPTDAERCELTRAIIKDIDWDCTVQTLFREKNLGCRKAVSSAIDWFFEQVDEGIILEDDCLPSASFFTFCADMLSRYRDDERIMQVSGTNLLEKWNEGASDYFFSYYGAIWGWATWKRAWKRYDVEMKLWNHPDTKQRIADILVDKRQVNTRLQICDLVYDNKIDTWDYQWTFCKLVNSGLSLNPAVNLVSNIGFTQDATHTKKESTLGTIARYELKTPAKENPIVVVDREFDALFYKRSQDSRWRKLISRVRAYLPQ